MKTYKLFVLMRCRNGRESSFEAQFYHPEEKKSVSIGLFYFKCPEDMEACEVEAARALDRVAFKFYDEKGWAPDRIQTKLSVRALPRTLTRWQKRKKLRKSVPNLRSAVRSSRSTTT